MNNEEILEMNNDHFHGSSMHNDHFHGSSMNNGKKFDIVLMNPPYSKNLHLKFMEKTFSLIDENGSLIYIGPDGWIINKYSFAEKSKLRNNYKEKYSKYIDDIETFNGEEFNKYFGTSNWFGASIFTMKHNAKGIDPSKYENTDELVNKVVKTITEAVTETYYVSCDYGTQNATVFLMWRQGISGKWYCIDEYYYSGRDETAQKTDNAYADDLEEFINGRKIKAVIVDPSAASFIALLKERGFTVRKARNDVIDGIRFTGTQLNTGNIAFLDICENTIKEFASYIWDAKACERGEDKPIKQHDHAMDAVRYFCFTIIYKPRAKLNRDIKGGI